MEAKIKITLDEKEKSELTSQFVELALLIEKANSLADELAHKIGGMRMSFKIGRVDD